MDIKSIKSLQQKKFRKELGCFVVEGRKSVLELLESGLVVKEIYATPAEIYDLPTQTIEIAAKQMGRMSGLKTPPGVLAIAALPEENTFPELDPEAPFLLLLDQVQDPGNLGTIIRLADWFGATVGLTQNCVETFNPKVVQASMGSLFKQQMHRHTDEEWASFVDQKGLDICLMDMEGDDLRAQSELKGAYLIGNEANGISTFWRQKAAKTISIPRFGEAESLNAAMAAGILLFALRS